MNLHPNNREFTRVPVGMEVEVTAGEKVIRSERTRDVSLKGLYLDCSQQFPVGTECRTVLILGRPGASVRIEILGRVGRVESSGMTVEFAQIELEGFEHLRKLILLNATNAEQVEKEFEDHLGIKKHE